MKITTKQIAIGGVLLALMIASQFLKNISVFITGPIVNLILIIATLSAHRQGGRGYGGHRQQPTVHRR